MCDTIEKNAKDENADPKNDGLGFASGFNAASTIRTAKISPNLCRNISIKQFKPSAFANHQIIGLITLKIFAVINNHYA